MSDHELAPPDGGEHWVDIGGRLHLTGPNQETRCGAFSGEPKDVIHYRQLPDDRERVNICNECITETEQEE